MFLSIEPDADRCAIKCVGFSAYWAVSHYSNSVHQEDERALAQHPVVDWWLEEELVYFDCGVDYDDHDGVVGDVVCFVPILRKVLQNTDSTTSQKHFFFQFQYWCNPHTFSINSIKYLNKCNQAEEEKYPKIQSHFVLEFSVNLVNTQLLQIHRSDYSPPLTGDRYLTVENLCRTKICIQNTCSENRIFEWS